MNTRLNTRLNMRLNMRMNTHTNMILEPVLKPRHGSIIFALVLLTACASPGPPAQLYQLRSEPPAPVQAVAGAPVLQLLSLTLPEVLERDALLLPQGQAGLQALSSHRWAEPLRDAVPRVLRQDLSALLGAAQVWGTSLPGGVVVQRMLRVEVLALQVNAARNAVQLQARWSLAAPGALPTVRVDTLSAALTSVEPDAIAAAHRLALWRLAETIAAELRPRAAPEAEVKPRAAPEAAVKPHAAPEAAVKPRAAP